MIELFYAPRRGSSKAFVARVLGEFYGFENVTFSRSATGKPRCDKPVFFSLSHTQNCFFLAVSNKEIGIDAENLSRRGNFTAITARLPEAERARALASSEEFLKIYTKREATAKFLGKPVFAVFSKIAVAPCCGEPQAEFVYLNGEKLPVILRTLEISGHAVSICATEGETVGKTEYLKETDHK